MDEVKAAVRGNATLSKIPFSSIRDKVRSSVKEKKEDDAKQSDAELPEAMESPEEKFRCIGLLQGSAQISIMDVSFADNRSVTSNTTLKSDKGFNEEQTDLMYEIFNDLISTNAPIRRSEILDTKQVHDQKQMTTLICK